MRFAALIVTLALTVGCATTEPTKGERALAALDQVSIGAAMTSVGSGLTLSGATLLTALALNGTTNTEAYVAPGAAAALGIVTLAVGGFLWRRARADFVAAIDDDSRVVERVKRAEDKRERIRPAEKTQVICTPGWDCPVEDE